MTPDILTPLSGLPEATPESILAARTAAGLSQAAASKFCWMADARSWWRVEAGKRAISPAAWAVFLLATGQHPTYKLVRKDQIADNCG